MNPEVWIIRAEYWRLLEDLRSGEVDAEIGEQMVSVLDSLAGLVKDAETEKADAEAPAKLEGGGAVDT